MYHRPLFCFLCEYDFSSSFMCFLFLQSPKVQASSELSPLPNSCHLVFRPFSPTPTSLYHAVLNSRLQHSQSVPPSNLRRLEATAMLKPASSAELARAVLSPDPLTRNSFLNAYASSSVTHTSPISSIQGLSHVKAALEVHGLFKKDVDVLDVSWDEAARVVVIDAETTWSPPVFGAVSTKSYGKTKIQLEEFEEDDGDGAVGGDQKSDGKGGRLVITEIQEDDSMDVLLAKCLPGFVYVTVSSQPTHHLLQC